MITPHIKGYRFRIYPSKQQAAFFAKQFGCCRVIYNHMLEMHEEVFEQEHRCLTLKEMNAMLPVLKKQEKTKWLDEVIALTLQMTVKDLDNAYGRYFKKVSSHPRFKSKYDRQCFKVAQDFKLQDDKLWIPKLKSGIKVNFSRALGSQILYLHISKSTTGKYYVSFTCIADSETMPKTGKQTGVDVGIKDAAILADGTRYENIKALTTLQKKLRYEQRQLSKKTKGSKHRQRRRKR